MGVQRSSGNRRLQSGKPFNSHGVGTAGATQPRQGSRFTPTLPCQALNSYRVRIYPIRQRDRVVASLQPCLVKCSYPFGVETEVHGDNVCSCAIGTGRMTLLQFPLHPSIAQRCSVLLECAGLGFCAIRHPLSVKTVRLRGVRRYTGLTGCRGGPDDNDYPPPFLLSPFFCLSVTSVIYPARRRAWPCA